MTTPIKDGGPAFPYTAWTYEVTSNAKTVWVNGTHCVGRFCQISAEYESDGEWKTLRPIRRSCTNMSDWKRWKRLMKELFNVKVDNYHTPQFLDKQRKS